MWLIDDQSHTTPKKIENSFIFSLLLVIGWVIILELLPLPISEKQVGILLFGPVLVIISTVVVSYTKILVGPSKMQKIIIAIVTVFTGIILYTALY